MANSPSHKFGQMLGDFFEEQIVSYFRKNINNAFYVDYKHSRPARNGKKEVKWKDEKGNEHKLDIVIEKGGTEKKLGIPKAFIEVAWRNYEKHSKNKAQEISGAIIPLIKTYSQLTPFYGCVLGGVFTDNSQKQLISEGFVITYFDKKTLSNVFEAYGINIFWKDDTKEEDFEKRIGVFGSVLQFKKEKLEEDFQLLLMQGMKQFMKDLKKILENKIARILIYTFYGKTIELMNIESAISFIEKYGEKDFSLPFVFYKIEIIYDNSGRISAEFPNKRDAIIFLDKFK